MTTKAQRQEAFAQHVQNRLNQYGAALVVDSDPGSKTIEAFDRILPPKGSGAPADLSLFTTTEQKKLAVLHPDLVRVLARARHNGANFRIDTVERSEKAQAAAVASGNSQTMDSRHRPSKKTGRVHAVDLYPLDDVDHDKVPWDWDDFYALAEQIRTAGQQEDVTLRWGGAWDRTWTSEVASAKATVAAYSARRRAAGAKSILLDGPHFELPAALYP